MSSSKHQQQNNVSFSSSVISQSRGRSTAQSINQNHNITDDPYYEYYNNNINNGIGNNMIDDDLIDLQQQLNPEWIEGEDPLNDSPYNQSFLEATSTSIPQSSTNIKRNNTNNNLKFKKSSDAQQRRSADVWTRLYQQEKGSRLKYYDTPKNMLLQLEQEREKRSELDTEYQRFSREALRERERLVRELKTLKQRATADLNNIQKALISKQDEYLELGRKADDDRQRYEETIVSLRNDREKLGVEIGRLKKVIGEHDQAVQEQRIFVSRLLDDKKKMQEMLGRVKDDVEGVRKQSAANETGWSKEREVRMQQDLHIRQLEHNLSIRDSDIQELRAIVARKDAELEEKMKLRQVVEQQKTQLDEVQMREKLLSEKLEQMHIRDKTTNQHLQEAETQSRRYLVEIQRLSQIESSLRVEIESLKTQNTASTSETREWVEKCHQKSQRADELSIALDKAISDLHQYQKQLQQAKYEREMLESRFTSILEEHRNREVESAENVKRLHGEISRVTEDNQRFKAIVDKLQHELEYCNVVMNNMDQRMSAQTEQETQLKAKYRDLTQEFDDLRQKFDQTKSQLDDQVVRNKMMADQFEMETKERDHTVTSFENKMKSLQEKCDRYKETVDEYQRKMRQVQESESKLQRMLEDKGKDVADVQDECRALAQHMKQVIGERDQLASQMRLDSQQFKDKMQKYRLDFEDKYSALERSKDEQLMELNERLRQTQNQLQAVDEEKRRLARKADNSAMEKELSMLKQTLAAKDEELKLSQLKYRNAAEHVKRLEIETRPTSAMSASATNNSITGALGGGSVGPYRMDNVSGISGLTRRLKEEVQSLMEKEHQRSTFTNSNGIKVSLSAGSDQQSIRKSQQQLSQQQ